MSSRVPSSAPPKIATAPSLQSVQASVQQLAHLLPAQAPLRDFVHHNTLHAFQHLPFAEALSAANRLTGARPWLDEGRYRKLFREGRVNADDLAAALRQSPETRADELLLGDALPGLRRGEILQAALLQPPGSISPPRLRWQIEEKSACERLQADLDPLMRQRLLHAAAADGHDEAAAVADLWATACALRGPTARPAVACAEPSATAAVTIWQELLDRLGDEWTLGALLAHLTGEDIRLALQASLIRHLAAHLDHGLAAWRNPARAQGFFVAWRRSAGSDWAWELDEFAGARHDIEQLADDPLQVIANELHLLDVDDSRCSAYLQRLAMELAGWAGMCHWHEAHAAAGDPPVSLTDFLAVRVVLERLYAEQLLRRVWGLRLNELGGYFINHPAELAVRHAAGSRQLPDDLLDQLRPHLTAEAAHGDWPHFAHRLVEARNAAATDTEALAAWPLFVLAQRLGRTGRELRELGRAGVDALLGCADSLTGDQRGLIWLLAYEHHYRQQIFAALLANHGRTPALAGKAQAQWVFCMDDREEGSRRHLEEVNPAFETFGAAGFFGTPMLWQGLDDELPTALCPIVVRPANSVRETVPPGAEAAYRRHQQRRQLRLAWRERLHQGSRRGWLQAALLSTAAAPWALLALLARTLAPGRLGSLLERTRDRFDKPLPGTLELTAEPGEAQRAASSDAPRLGFSEEEQLTRVGTFLRSIGLTKHFAPLILIVGHGSDSRNNPHLAAYDCGACSGRHGGPNARVFAAMANRPALRLSLARQGIVIPETTHFIGAEHNTCDESYVWYDLEQLPASHREAFAALRRDCQEAARHHAVERCRRFASAPLDPSPQQAQAHLANRRQDIGQARPELGHATVAAAFVGRRTMSRGAFFDRRVFLISYDPLPDADGHVLEATLLAAGPVGAGINLEYYFSTVNNEGYGCGSKIMHNLTGLFGIMQGASSDLRTGLPLQMVEIHEPMRLLVIVEQTLEIINAIYQRQPPLQELIGKEWIVLAAKHPQTGAIHLFAPATGWQPWSPQATGQPAPDVPEAERSSDWFAGQRKPLPPALLRRPVMTA
ncbi:MAG: DUF2309 domain-containing protein [Candidatus Accumulibacter sp.]|nr:DUF2309 domain-containing protein [Accumulibacter sp.]